MLKLVPIVEGPGETTAVPVLIIKILKAKKCYTIEAATPKNAHGRESLTKDGGLEKFLDHAANERDCGAILILLDVEEGCALDLVRDLAVRASNHYVPHPIVVVIVAANRMYENWILASLVTVRGSELDELVGLPADTPLPTNAEVENGKVYIQKHLPQGRGYKETSDQEAMTHLIDIDEAKKNSRSFRRLCHAIEEVLERIDKKQGGVTPDLASVAEALIKEEEIKENEPKRKGKEKP